MRLLVTGAAGFIGSNLVKYVLKETEHSVFGLDKLAYSGNIKSLKSVLDSDLFCFEKVDVCDKTSVEKIIQDFKPNKIIHLAAESHVDRSINSPYMFFETNVMGTLTLLNCSLDYFRKSKEPDNFLFLHVSTDEVFGELASNEKPFSEVSQYRPNSPYSASKAASDHIVRAWNKTYGLPTITTNCSNNYGPYQYPEKLIPKTIINGIKLRRIPIYGNGNQVRDWLFVEDHVKCLVKLACEYKGKERKFNLGGNTELKNIEIVTQICNILDKLLPNHESYSNLIDFVSDRPGHDKRYAINNSKIETYLNWRPTKTFDKGLFETVEWYIRNSWWWEDITTDDFQF